MNIDIPLDLYKVFCCVVQKGNMSDAAKTLFITQPAVSMSIKILEEKMGSQLLYRSSKGVQPTAEGSVLFEYLNQAMGLIQTAEQKYFELLHLEAGSIRIGASDTISSQYLMGYIQRFVQQYPHIHLHVTNKTSYETIQQLKSGNVDMGFVNLPIQEEPTLVSYECRKITDVLVGGEKYKALAQKGLSIQEIGQYPLLLMEKGSSTRTFLDAFAQKHGVTLKPCIELASSDLLLNFAKMNLGLSFVVDDFYKSHVDQNVLYRIPLVEPISTRSIGLVKLRDVTLSHAANQFISLLGL